MRQLTDKTGMLIHPNDCLKVFHYKTKRGRRYMYKWVVLRAGELYALHSGSLSPTEPDGYFLWPSANKDGCLTGVEILNRNDNPKS